MTPTIKSSKTTQVTFTALLALASLSCLAFAICDICSYNLNLESRLVRFAITISVVMLGSCVISFALSKALQYVLAQSTQEVISEYACELKHLRKELAEQTHQRQKLDQELSSARDEFETARRSVGMAEFAAGILHNVGNVLNSVNVSATNQSTLLMSSKLSQLERVIELLEKDDEKLAEFFSRDEKGKQLPRYMRVLFDHLMEEKQSLFEQSQSLIKNVDHLKSIISTQQSYATSGGLLEPVEIETLFEDAINLHTESFKRHGIKIERDYASIPPVLIDKQRVMQIIINLVKNAKEAMHGQKDGTKVMTLRSAVADDCLLMEVVDTGMGIEQANLGRMFTHGFTTKPSGHGFGLHSCANAANEMEGSLSVQSAGTGLGATFHLRLPFKPAMAHL